MWTPISWKNHPIKQDILYPNEDEFNRVLTSLSHKAPLVAASEIDSLNGHLEMVAKGNGFILQGGDCAESFANCTEDEITLQFQLLQKMSLVLNKAFNKPLIRIGRIAGQYSKPRSMPQEKINHLSLPCYRGDLINHHEFNVKARQNDPKRLLKGYECAKFTLAHLKLLAASDKTPFYTSHEALHLPYESALTRKINDKWYNLSTHFPWAGIRTSDLNDAHINYLSGIENPIAIKIGPNTTPAFIQRLVEKLNPTNKLGKLTLITRLGCKSVEQQLPLLISAVQKTGLTVLWSCDPMHGNTLTTKNRVKTRRFNDVFKELSLTLDHHLAQNSLLNGIHLELTHAPVTECLGGTLEITEEALDNSYHSLLDPRLNQSQAMEMVFKLAAHILKQPEMSHFEETWV